MVFEDVQGRPISEYPERRVFARDNVCKSMIDCKGNPYGREKCWESDKLGGKMAKDQGKGVLYRCHKGIGFPNFLFPTFLLLRILLTSGKSSFPTTERTFPCFVYLESSVK